MKYNKKYKKLFQEKILKKPPKIEVAGIFPLDSKKI